MLNQCDLAAAVKACKAAAQVEGWRSGMIQHCSSQLYRLSLVRREAFTSCVC